MHIDTNTPYVPGGEVVGSVLSALMALTFLYANQHFVTTRMMRLFFITTYHAVFTYAVMSTSLTHLLINHFPIMGVHLPIDDYYVHIFDPRFILANSWILVGVLYSFMTNKDGD